jgi:hypothetical protein
VTDYRAEDLLKKKQWRMCSAMAFINSGGTLSPARIPRGCQLPGLPFLGSVPVFQRQK